jgi:Protein of unknown function (DUF732)
MTQRHVMRSAHPAALLAAGVAVGCGLSVGATQGLPEARADVVAYLVNVTVRPGYGFADVESALSYGNELCMRIRDGRSYSDLMREVKSDFANPDEYQASYLVTQAVNELCPELIWQLRNSAAHYRTAEPR